MAGKRSLPLSVEWADEDTYVESLLSFAANTKLFRNLCGGIHILDFLTREPDLYTTVLPASWRDWFEDVPTMDVLDLLLREDLKVFSGENNAVLNWRGLSPPPEDLVEYIRTVRSYCLDREPVAKDQGGRPEPLPQHIRVGMKPKKAHEVENFAGYVNNLARLASEEYGSHITDIVDFGSGQNYLGRTLASPPYHKHVIAVERRHHVVQGARGMDVHAKLANKEKIMRNKKEWKRLQQEGIAQAQPQEEPHHKLQQELQRDPQQQPQQESKEQESLMTNRLSEIVLDDGTTKVVSDTLVEQAASNKGRITYIEHDITDGYLEGILRPKESKPQIQHDISDGQQLSEDQNYASDINSHHEAPAAGKMVVSLHSCGNLVHHGLRSIVLNPSVSAVAMIGCCYNLMTERLGPATYKLDILRPLHPRLESTSSSFDPHGFPMSRRLEGFQHEGGTGLRLNITARMMAVQAPYNWGPEDSEAFFRRHYYRALLQRILLDLGVVDKPIDGVSVVGGVAHGVNVEGSPLIVGSLRKAAFVSFHAYARAALEKLGENEKYKEVIRKSTANLTDERLSWYETEYGPYKKRLAVIWSLMAFSAGVVESIIAVDRWLFLREQENIEACWVDSVFEYAQSPRNLVVVGIKKSSGSTDRQETVVT